MIWSRPKLQVLFVCTANVCRSPLAEGLLRHRLNERNLANQVVVRSAGTHAAQRNRRPDPRVEELADEMGVSLAGIRARMITPKLLTRSDYVLVMERQHLEHVRRQRHDLQNTGSIFTPKRPVDETNIEKVLLLGDFLTLKYETGSDIPDPYFGDRQGFYNVYQMIDSALTGFLDHIGREFNEPAPTN